MKHFESIVARTPLAMAGVNYDRSAEVVITASEKAYFFHVPLVLSEGRDVAKYTFTATPSQLREMAQELTAFADRMTNATATA